MSMADELNVVSVHNHVQGGAILNYPPTARCVWSTHRAYYCICYQGAFEWL
jgi:hypothetical protein